ncbi:MAG: hypothetical protein WC227_00010 [Patescibacteria group bacterium]|jgi:hypothetical protein
MTMSDMGGPGPTDGSDLPVVLTGEDTDILPEGEHKVSVDLLETPTDSVIDLQSAKSYLPEVISSQLKSSIISEKNLIRIGIDAYKIAEGLRANNPENKTPEKLVGDFARLPLIEQSKIVKGLSENSTGGSFHDSCLLAIDFLHQG